MKRRNNLYYEICRLSNIRFIYDQIIYKNTRNKRKILEFDNFYITNLLYIKYMLSSFLYKPGRYNIFLIYEPKVRVIMSQNIYDKLINHLVSYYILKPVIEPCLINQNIATREGKGTDYGIKLFKKYINEIKLDNDYFYVLKFDISKYFYNIDHQVLKDMLSKKIKDKKALKIVYDIIDSTNEEYINLAIKHFIKKYNNIDIGAYLYKKDKGLPIGNMTSQILAIFYLNELDHYIKEELNIKYYIRYMDDGVLMHHDKNYLKFCLKKINDMIESRYHLHLNSKTKIYSIKEGVEFLGFRYILKNKRLIVKVRTQTKRKFKRKLRYLKSHNLKRYRQVVGSYKGHLEYANSKNLWYENVG